MTDLEHLARNLEHLQEDVDYLTALLEPDLTSAGPLTFTPAPSGTQTHARAIVAHVWHQLTPTQAADAWTSLTNWVDWLTDRYQLENTIPACWYRHGALIEELDALHAAWQGAYHDPQARPTDPANWHELLARGLSRIHEWDHYGCASGNHHEEPAPHPDARSHATRDAHLQETIHAAVQRSSE